MTRLLRLTCLHRLSSPTCQSAARCLSTAATPKTTIDSAFPAASINPLQQRYNSLVNSGVLKPDQQQEVVVSQLAQLYEQLVQYRAAMQEYQQQLTSYQDRRQARLKQLEAHDAHQEQQQQQQQQAPGPAPSSTTGLQWFKQLLGSTEATAGKSEQELQREAQQRARAAARRRQQQVLQELGQPPAAPAAPQGAYIHGSVGSGKSLLMDLLHSCVQQHVGLQHLRRMHFNAAMLELHQRLHLLDTQRRQQQDQQMHEYVKQQAAALLAGPHAPHPYKPEPEADEDDDDSSSSDQQGGRTGQEFSQVLSSFFDPEVRRQKQAKAAVLAIRKHLVAARHGRVSHEDLGRANSAYVREAARSFIRGSAGDVRSGWGSAPGHVSALLCFDEVQVTDVFSAVALKGLFEALLAEGCVIVTTSNRAPWELPRHGLHEDMFGHFVHTIEQSCSVLNLSAQQDYRRLIMQEAATSFAPVATSSGMQQQQAMYFWPLGSEAEQQLHATWHAITKAQPGTATQLQVMFGRHLEVQRSAAGVAWFQFEELCARPLGAADYLSIAQSYHTVFLAGVPAMSMKNRDQARRFITLVDELYNARARLVCSAACPPDELFAGADSEEPLLELEDLQFETAVEGGKLRRNLMAEGGVAPVQGQQVVQSLGGLEERFAFSRAVSRLYEMQSPRYCLARSDSCG